MKKILIALTISMFVLFSSQAFAEERATTEECIMKTHEAAAIINARGLEASIKMIGDPKGPFVWKDSYVFLMDLKGKMLAHPMQPELMQNEHVLLQTDAADKAIFVHFVNIAKDPGQGWVDYMWPKPGKKSPSKKVTYIYRVPSKDLLVGAGVYVGGMMY
ncbi:MAG: cache domain-containing protein [Proteobacteria bacterium]|nr:cache domain-containing protein [Pseudomonadota bacterium]MBU1233043.1 cache domain-containing protein [Pseudomonadota bacterium]MBU1419460.1 cache domain-containing protein [Pseudomonadota bacterium]MBU1454026.1 cache domain-containing protein [Pseudomonadota bacterium]